jgi:hypothetical protein
MRAATFEMLRGFGDYHQIKRNKCGLDTEFYVRAYHAGTRFAISRDVVLKYRRHPLSATRNEETGWGTAPRAWTEAENIRRFKYFRRGRFDPRVFGGLNHYWGLTHRIGGP